MMPIQYQSFIKDNYRAFIDGKKLTNDALDRYIGGCFKDIARLRPLPRMWICTQCLSDRPRELALDSNYGHGDKPKACGRCGSKTWQIATFQARSLCWYNGAYVASIVMAQLAFEELLRGHYRTAGINKLPTCSKSVDRADFIDLINEAANDGYITKEEADEMHEIRRNYRNPYVHVKDAKMKDGKQDLDSPSFIIQGMKAHCRNPYGENVDDEARRVIEILVKCFIPLCRRHNGF